MSHLPRLSSETITVSSPPMQRSTLLSGPWIDIAADLLGPMPSREHLLVVVDYYSRYFEVERLTRIRTVNIIASLKTMFSRYGAPYAIRTNNGLEFRDKVFLSFWSHMISNIRQVHPYGLEPTGK